MSVFLFGRTRAAAPPPPAPPAPTTRVWFPQHKVEIAFTTNPTSGTPVWTDVSVDARGFSIRRGRQHELGRVEAGTLNVRLANRHRRYDPSNTSSIYYPNVLPMRRIRVSAVWGTTYQLFHGFVERWPPVRNGIFDAEVTVEASDAFTVLANVELDQVFVEQLSGGRVNTVLNAIGWPATDRVVDAGRSVIAPADLEGVTALEHLQQVAASENGLLFADAYGRVVFHDRFHRTTLNPTPVGTFGDSNVKATGETSELPYVDLQPSFDMDELYNEVRISLPAEPDPAVASDATSQTRYFRRTLGIDTLLSSWEEANDMAAYLVGRFKEPSLRIDSMALKPRMEYYLWTHVLAREISDRITVLHRPPGGGPTITRQVFIEGVSHTVEKQGSSWQWLTDWQLSPADLQNFWKLEHATFGALDTGGKLAY